MLAYSQGLSLLGTDGISGASGGEISPATFNKGWKQVLQLTWLSSSVLMFLRARPTSTGAANVQAQIDSTSVSIFKAKLKTYLFRQAYF